jgi:hypothetical protein
MSIFANECLMFTTKPLMFATNDKGQRLDDKIQQNNGNNQRFSDRY